MAEKATFAAIVALGFILVAVLICVLVFVR